MPTAIPLKSIYIYTHMITHRVQSYHSQHVYRKGEPGGGNIFYGYLFSILRLVAELGLEQTLYTVPEDVGEVEVCVAVYRPVIECPIILPVTVILLLNSDDPGIYVSFK